MNLSIVIASMEHDANGDGIENTGETIIANARSSLPHQDTDIILKSVIQNTTGGEAAFAHSKAETDIQDAVSQSELSKSAGTVKFKTQLVAPQPRKITRWVLAEQHRQHTILV